MQRFMLCSVFVALFAFLSLTCSVDNATAPEMSQAPEISQSDQLPDPLAKKVTTYFNGISTNTGMLAPPKIINLPNGVIMWRGLVVQTDDDLSDSRVDGIVTWVVNLDIYPDDTDKRWGSGELTIPGVGRWDMTYKGWKTPEEGVTYEVDGHGKGELRGLTAHWTYLKPPTAAEFTVNGYIIERN